MTRAECAACLLGHDRYVILTHRRPDGDTIGSAAALCRGLRSLGRQAWVLRNPQFTPRFAPYLEGLVCDSIPENACVVSVDIAADSLLPLVEGLPARWALGIDHHNHAELSADQLLQEPDKAACGEIIFALLELMEVPMDKAMAEALYVALSTDTGCFKYANTTENTFLVVSRLLALGADIFPINKVFFDTKSMGRLQLEAYLTEHMELLADGLVGICTMPQALLEKLAVNEDDIDSISGFPRSVEGVEIGVMIREVEHGEGKISVRTGRDYDASELCRQLGGGGHAGAAGASVPGGIEAARAAVLEVLKRKGIL